MLAFLSAAFALAAAATPLPPQDSGGPTCNREGSTIEMNACFADDLGLEEARMQTYLQAARQHARESDESEYAIQPSQQMAWLESSQIAWEAYAEARCAGVYDQFAGGTIRTIMSLDCWIQATRQRTHDIWVDHLTYMDSTPPVLPEPLKTVRDEQVERGEAN